MALRKIDQDTMKLDIGVPLVSIVCTAYNHRDYIENTLEGFVMQQTSFPFEVIVHDDASTDDTVNVIKKYEQKYPHLFHNIYQVENQYSRGVDIWRYLFQFCCRGKYIAICEGDDYWIDPMKLQKQVDFLEEHQNYGMVYGCVYYYQQNIGKFINTFGKNIEVIQDLLRGNVIPTLTVCMRRSLYLEYVKEIKPLQQNWKMADYPMWLWFSYKSSVKFMEDVLGVYRILPESMSHSANFQKELDFVESYASIKRFFLNRFGIEDPYIIRNIEEQYLIGVYRIVIRHHMSSDVIKERIKEITSRTFKIYVICFAIRIPVIRRLLRWYWGIS